MKVNRLGKSDLMVSELGFGCMSLGENQLLNAHLLHKAIENGVNYFDTADLYDKGLNELHVGSALKDVRKKIILATKVGNQWRSDGKGWDWNPSKEYILKEADQSLRRLKTDYIDLYQLHGGTMDDPIDETIEAFELLKKQGKIRWYGISSIRPNVIHEYIKRSNIASVMMQYSILDHRPEEQLLDLLHKHQIGVLVRGALAQGLLAGKAPKEYLQFTDSEVLRVSKIVDSIAKKSSADQAVIALKYVLDHPAVVAAVTGIRTEVQLDEVLEVSKNIVLSRSDINRLRSSVRRFHYKEHRYDD